VLATGPGNPPADRVWTGKRCRFGSRTVQKPHPLLLGGPNPASYPSNRGFRHFWLDPSGPISGFSFQVVLFMVAFRYPTADRKILKMVPQCSFWMYWPTLWSNYVDKRSLPHPGNQRQRSINDFTSFILVNQSRHWLQIVITEVLASIIGKSRSDTLLPHLEDERQMSVNDWRSRILGNISGAWLQTSIQEELAASLGR